MPFMKCPNCAFGYATEFADYGTECPTCGATLVEQEHSAVPDPPVTSQPSKHSSIPKEDRLLKAIKTRYGDAYVVAHTTTTVGSAIKVVGGLLGLLVFFISLVVGRDGSFGTLLFFLGAVAGALIASLFYVLGVLISAQGQVLLAAIDVAVNAAPGLSERERLELMDLPS